MVDMLTEKLPDFISTDIYGMLTRAGGTLGQMGETVPILGECTHVSRSKHPEG